MPLNGDGYYPSLPQRRNDFNEGKGEFKSTGTVLH
jgi:hypothetical protein